VLVDADEDAGHRWRQIRDCIAHAFPNAPLEISKEGIVLRNSSSKAFGAWIMPDNMNRGMLESFLLYLRPEDNQPLLDFAREAVLRAKNLGAPFSDNHHDKAQIHTWLSWQSPPGRQLHNAIMEKMLHKGSPRLQAFLNWFRELYSIDSSL
jgi:hypothetical protein